VSHAPCGMAAAAGAAKPAPRREFLPNQTIYIKNLNEKVRKTELKKALYACFSQFGPILDLVAMKTAKMRGQAFIVFRDVIAATNAMREMQNFTFFDKPLVIQYAKEKSDTVAKIDGTFVPRERKVRGKEEKKRKAEAPPDSEPSAKRLEVEPAGAQGLGASSGPAGAAAARRVAVPQPDLTAPPNKTLFVQNLPDDVSEGMLVPLFQALPGFVEVRLVPGKKGICFVEFLNEMQSGGAMVELQGFRIDNAHQLVISFQKRL